MFQAISVRLARLAQRARDRRLIREHQIAAGLRVAAPPGRARNLPVPRSEVRHPAGSARASPRRAVVAIYTHPTSYSPPPTVVCPPPVSRSPFPPSPPPARAVQLTVKRQERGRP